VNAKDKKPKARHQALRVLQVDEINVYPAYQRVPRSGVKGIVKDFEPLALGVITVAERPNLSLWLMDGLQRVCALKQLGITTVRADVIPCETVEEEATLFRRLNKRTALSAIELFNSQIIGRDPVSLDIVRIAESNGFKVPTRRVSGRRVPANQATELACVGRLQRSYRSIGADGLSAVLAVLAQLWPDDPKRTKNEIVGGLSTWYANREGGESMDRLVSRLKGTTPERLLYSSALGSGDRHKNMADLIKHLYHKRAPKQQGGGK
jgi:hypothetical protein